MRHVFLCRLCWYSVKIAVADAATKTTQTEQNTVHGIICDLRIISMFETLDMIHGRDTRSKARGDLVVKETRTRFGEFAIFVFGSRIWNLLPAFLRQSKSYNIFVSGYSKLKDILTT